MKTYDDIFLSPLSMEETLGGFFKLPAGGRWVLPTPTRGQESKFYFITEGACTITVEGTEYVGKAGDLFLIPEGTLHSYYNHKEACFSKYWVHFDLLPDPTLLSRLSLPHFISVPPKGKIYRLFRRYDTLRTRPGLADRIALKAVLLELLGEYIAAASPGGVTLPTEEDDTIGAVLSYISEHPAEPLTMAELAARCYLHPNHFSRLFKARTGQTPARYVRYRKMELAKSYLEKSDLPIKEIMERIGETDPFAFSKRFKSYSSYSPRDYRRLFRKS
ncbi:MAG: AraC family transcriptional regulator [Clostridia bacterium]|nr:AraC family transcriptional regulator [Clostridia bacterium]